MLNNNKTYHLIFSFLNLKAAKSQKHTHSYYSKNEEQKQKNLKCM